MRESFIWRAILSTFAVTALVGLIALLDPGFLIAFKAFNVIPVSTGQRIEILATSGGLLSRGFHTDLYFLEQDGSFGKVATFEQIPQCVTDFDGQLFVTFENAPGEGGAASSIFKDGRWVRSISAPKGLSIIDVVSFGGTVYAIGTADANKKVAAVVLTPEGWKPAGNPLDAGKEVTLGGWIRVGDLIYALYATGPQGPLGGLDLQKTSWYLVSFDGSNWGGEMPLDVPAGVLPYLSVYDERLCVLLVTGKEDDPVRLAFVTSGKLEVAAEIPAKDKGLIVAAWLIDLAGMRHVFLAGPGRLWDVVLQALEPHETRELLGVEGGSLVRSRLYVAVMGLGAVLLVGLGIAWLVVRVKTFAGVRKR